MKCKIRILDVKLSGNMKIVVVKCYRSGREDTYEFSVDKNYTEEQVLESIKSQLGEKANPSLVGKEYELNI